MRHAKRLLPLTSNTTGSRDWNIGVNDGNRIVLTPASTGNETALDQAMDTAKDVIDRRINALGTLEPTIIRQGENRIVVQVPGLDDPEALKALIGKTAKLEFKLVDEQADPDQTAKGIARVGSQVLPYPEIRRDFPISRCAAWAALRATSCSRPIRPSTSRPTNLS